MYHKHTHLLWIIAVLVIITLQACGGGGGATATGVATVSLTDAPGDFDHVWITVKDIRFHTSDGAGPGEAGWLRFPLAKPVTVDLLKLSKGVVGNPLWENIALPIGRYQQIRLVLAPTDPSVQDPLTTTALDASMTFNDEVVIGKTHYPLRIPDAGHGIRLAGMFQITNRGTLRLAIDFDADHDIVDIQRTVNGITLTEYILKPRLDCFDLDDAGAIVGHLDPTSAATATTSAHFVIKAEQENDPMNPQYHVVKRSTIVDPSTGKFVFYPLRPGTYDIVIRGIGYQTVIIKGVMVTRGTTPQAGATTVPMITMTTGNDYSVDGAITSPTGAWVNFYQTLMGAGELPYEIRFRHFNPITGTFSAFKLSSDKLWVTSYGTSTAFASGPTATVPSEGLGQFRAAADAILYSRATYTANGSDLISSATTTVSFGMLSPDAPASNSISGSISVPSMGMMDTGLLFAVHDGMIVNTIPVDGQMMSGDSYTMTNVPGGTPTTPLRGAFYGVDALGWSSTTSAKAIAIPRIADLRTGNAAGIDMNMIMLP